MHRPPPFILCTSEIMQNDLIPIARFRDLPSAGLAQSRLEAEGIYSFIPNETVIGLGRPYTVSWSGIELRVPADQAERAVQILNLLGSTEPAQAASHRLDQGSCCPRCGSTEVYDHTPGSDAKFFSLLTFLAHLFLRRKNTCKRCGNIFPRSRT